MRIRSWMTAGTLLAGLAFAFAATSFARAAEADGENATVENTVKLEIQISGLGPNGGKVEIKPAHPGCKFKPLPPVTLKKGAAPDVVKLEPIAVVASTTSADRDCSFEITLTEPGRTPVTFRRGLQLSPASSGSAKPSRTLKCYLPATAVASKDDPKTSKPRR